MFRRLAHGVFWFADKIALDQPVRRQPMVIRDILWTLCHPAGLAGGGFGISMQQASRLTIPQIENLYRATDSDGRLILSPNVMRLRMEKEMADAATFRAKLKRHIERKNKEGTS